MTPERHDDVEYVVGGVGGDVTPEETHEPSALVALVEKYTARCKDSFEVGQVHSHRLGVVGYPAVTSVTQNQPPGVDEPPHIEVCVSRRGYA